MTANIGTRVCAWCASTAAPGTAYCGAECRTAAIGDEREAVDLAAYYYHAPDSSGRYHVGSDFVITGNVQSHLAPAKDIARTSTLSEAERAELQRLASRHVGELRVETEAVTIVLRGTRAAGDTTLDVAADKLYAQAWFYKVLWRRQWPGRRRPFLLSYENRTNGPVAMFYRFVVTNDYRLVAVKTHNRDTPDLVLPPEWRTKIDALVARYGLVEQAGKGGGGCIAGPSTPAITFFGDGRPAADAAFFGVVEALSHWCITESDAIDVLQYSVSQDEGRVSWTHTIRRDGAIVSEKRRFSTVDQKYGAETKARRLALTPTERDELAALRRTYGEVWLRDPDRRGRTPDLTFRGDGAATDATPLLAFARRVLVARGLEHETSSE